MTKDEIKKRIAEVEKQTGEMALEVKSMKAVIDDFVTAMMENDAVLAELKKDLGRLEKLESPIDMSFYRGTLDKGCLKAFIEKTDKPIRYTYGFKYRNPTTLNVPVSKEKALQIVDSQSLLDAKELDDVLDLQAYSSNDMW